LGLGRAQARLQLGNRRPCVGAVEGCQESILLHGVALAHVDALNARPDARGQIDLGSLDLGRTTRRPAQPLRLHAQANKEQGAETGDEEGHDNGSALHNALLAARRSRRAICSTT